MVVAIDASTPASWTCPDTTAAATVVSSAAFSPPAGSILVVAFSTDTPSGVAPLTATITNTGTALTWNKAVTRDPSNSADGFTGIYWAYNAAAQTNITIGMSYNGGSGGARVCKCFVLTGCDTTTPIPSGATNFTDDKTNAAPSVAVTNGSRASGMMISSTIDWNQVGAPTMSNGTVDATINQSGIVSGGLGHLTASAATTAYTANWTYPATIDGHSVGAIFQPAAGGGSSATVAGVLATTTTAAAAGTVTATRAATITGPLATTTTAAAAGTVTATRAATITGPLAAATVSATAGSVTTSATISGPASSSTASATAGSVTTSASVTVTAPASAAPAAAPAGTVTVTASINLTGPVAAAATAAPAGVVSAGGVGPWLQATTSTATSSTTGATLTFGVATAGHLLVAVCAGAVTFTTPTGWSLLASSVATEGVYVFSKTAAANESSFTTTNNGNGLPIIARVYEFPAGASLGASASSGGTMLAAAAANPAITPTLGQAALAVVEWPNGAGTTATTTTWSGATKDVDQSAPYTGGVDGYEFSVGYIANSDGSSFAPVGQPNDVGSNKQAISFAVSTGVATVTGPTGTVGVAAPAGAVTAARAATVTGPAAAVTAAAPAGAAGMSASPAGPVATVSVTAPAGAVTTVQSPAVAGPTAGVTATAPAGTVAAGNSLTVGGPAAAVTAFAPPGTLGPTPWLRESTTLGTTSTSGVTLTFAPATAGHLLVAACAAPASCSTPTGWTLLDSSVAGLGMYVFTKTAAANESSFTTTNNGGGLPIIAQVYEFTGGASLGGHADTGGTPIDAAAANPSITPTAGQLALAVIGWPNTSGTNATTTTWTGATKDVDHAAPYTGGVDGYEFSVGYTTSDGSAFAPVGQPNDVGTHKQALSFAVSTGAVTVFGPTAAGTAAAPAGTVTTVASRSVAGPTAAVTAMALVGAAATDFPWNSGATWNATDPWPGPDTTIVAGSPAAATAAAPAGTVTVGHGATPTGPVATAAVTAPAGTVAVGQSITLAGGLATATALAYAGTVQASRALAGLTGTVTVAAPAGTVTAVHLASVAGPTARVTAAAPPGLLSAPTHVYGYAKLADSGLRTATVTDAGLRTATVTDAGLRTATVAPNNGTAVINET